MLSFISCYKFDCFGFCLFFRIFQVKSVVEWRDFYFKSYMWVTNICLLSLYFDEVRSLKILETQSYSPICLLLFKLLETSLEFNSLHLLPKFWLNKTEKFTTNPPNFLWGGQPYYDAMSSSYLLLYARDCFGNKRYLCLSEFHTAFSFESFIL